MNELTYPVTLSHADCSISEHDSPGIEGRHAKVYGTVAYAQRAGYAQIGWEVRRLTTRSTNLWPYILLATAMMNSRVLSFCGLASVVMAARSPVI